MAMWSFLISRPGKKAAHPRPSLMLFFCLVGAFLLTLVPHFQQLPVWISLSVVTAMVIRSVLEFYRLPLPSSAFCNIMALCLLGGIFLQFNTMFGREAGTAFMAGLLAIKFFELRGPRDIAVIIFSSFFVVMSALLYSQVLELFVYCLIMMWLLTALLVRIQIGDTAQDRLLTMLSQSGIVFLQALPLTIFLFFFFPRFPGKLQMTLQETPTGLSDTVKPGSIAQLSKDDSEAFYVKFQGGDIPSVDTMYWRAMVLWQYKDGIWTRGPMAEVPEEKNNLGRVPHSSEIWQEITVYPHFQKWLFALDRPISNASNADEKDENIDNWSVILSGNVLQLSGGNSQVDHKERYRVDSAAQLLPQVMSPAESVYSLQLPAAHDADAIDPDVIALAKKLRSESADEQAYVFTVLHYFRHNHFVYSASTEISEKGDWLHNFLFTTKSGFCEHYASAFAVLMRLEKIPARLVVGYQGAQFNPYDNTYVVRQSDAHAWDEVWIESKKSWLRVDPTAILPPSANQPTAANGGQGGEEDEGNLSIQVASHSVPFLTNAQVPNWLRHTLQEMRLRREQLETNWDDLVFSYNPDTQNQLAQALGFGRNYRFVFGLACLVAGGICVVIFRSWIRQRAPVSPVERFYAAFCRSMARCGVPRDLWEGPLAYTERVAEAFPDKKDAIYDAGRIVADFRYGAFPTEMASPKELDSLLASITAAQAASSSREQTS